MSFEETLVCDGCSRVIDAGSRETTMGTLRDGGRAFVPHSRNRSTWEEIAPSEPWGRSRRHLCADCADQDMFFDGQPIPAAFPRFSARMSGPSAD